MKNFKFAKYEKISGTYGFGYIFCILYKVREF